MITENDILDYVFQTLYLNLDKNEMHFEDAILSPSGLQLESKQIEHIRELMMNTGLVHQSIGFGKLGRVYLNGKGIQIMKKYKSYQAYVQQEESLQSLMGLGTAHKPTGNISSQANNPAGSTEDPPPIDDDMAH